MKQCLSCGKDIVSRNVYCNNKCQADHAYKQFIDRYLDGLEDGMSGEYQTSNHLKRYLMEKYNNKCSECGWGEVNPTSGTIPLELEHIDGNHKNNLEANITLLCPNCHSLTPTYKGANKGNGRKSRSKYYDKP